MNYWMHRIKPAKDDKQGPYSKELFEKHNILTTGWSYILLEEFKDKSIDEISDYDLDSRLKGSQLSQLRNFLYEMEIGDIVMVPDPIDKDFFWICKIKSLAKKTPDLPIKKIGGLQNQRVSFNQYGYLCVESYHDGLDIGAFREIELLSDRIFKPKEVWFDIGVTWLMDNNSNSGKKNIEYIKKFLGDTMLKSQITSLLKSNHNLILTGAPGTGKTHLAKEIAEELIKDTQQVSAEELINTYLENPQGEVGNKRFDLSYEVRTNALKKLSEFQRKFPKEKLKDLTLDQYCVGQMEGDEYYNDNFCYWLEWQLLYFSSYKGGNSGTKYHIYFSKDDNAYKLSSRFSSDTPEIAMKKIAEEVHELVNNKAPQPSSFLTPAFQNKILCSYYPDEYFPINRPVLLDRALKIMGQVPTDKGENECEKFFAKNKQLVEIVKKKIASKISENNPEIKLFDISRFLFYKFGLELTFEEIEDKAVTQKGERKFVQFHPSYDYTDFVEGIRPTKKDGVLGFEHKNGIFKEFCIKAKNNPSGTYIFIIDEINRGELNKIFGELFFAIDPGYRGTEGRITTQYANIDESESMHEEYPQEFFVPENVYILGTMNDIDRSVESFDFAIRRRFAWIEISPDDTFDTMFKSNKTLDMYKEEARKKMTALNEEIKSIEVLGEQYCIGGAYFLKIEQYEGDFSKLWKNHLELLLKEYLRGSVDASNKLSNLKKVYQEGVSCAYGNDVSETASDEEN